MKNVSQLLNDFLKPGTITRVLFQGDILLHTLSLLNNKVSAPKAHGLKA